MQHPGLEEHQDDVEGGAHGIGGPDVHRRPAQQLVAGDEPEALGHLLAHGGRVLGDSDDGLGPADVLHGQARHHEAQGVDQ